MIGTKSNHMDEISLLKARIDALEAENAGLRNNQVEINQAKELYLKIFEDFPALIWRSGLDKNCNYFNRTWLEFTGRTMEQEDGNGWAEGVHPDDFDFCLETYVNAFDRREAFLMEYRLRNKDGEYRWLSDFGRPFYDLDNTFLGYIGSCYDITERRDTLNKLEELNAMKNKFLSILAHDLRSPFSGIIGLSSLWLDKNDTNLTNDTEQIMRNIHLSATNALAYLDDLLLWGKMISDGIVLQKQPFQVGEVCQEIIHEFEDMARMKHITFELSETDSVRLTADMNMFKTILRNLLYNALKFTNRNGTVKILPSTTSKGVELTVQDNGVGMDPETLETLWAFSTHHSTKGTDNESGTGFGLTICKQLVEKHQGSIRATSVKGQGSQFTVQFPA